MIQLRSVIQITRIGPMSLAIATLKTHATDCGMWRTTFSLPRIRTSSKIGPYITVAELISLFPWPHLQLGQF